MLESLFHRYTAHLLRHHIKKCLALPGGRSRPDKCFHLIRFALDKATIRGKTILDLGCGRGSYGYLLRKVYGSRFSIIGVELHREYATSRSFLSTCYEQVLWADIRDAEVYKRPFDIALACDVLEHLEVDEAISLVQRINALDKLLIASIPISETHWHQSEKYERNNPLEKHRHNWTIREVETVLGLDLLGSYSGIGTFVNRQL